MPAPIVLRWDPRAADLQGDLLEWWRLAPPKVRRNERMWSWLLFGLAALLLIGTIPDFDPSLLLFAAVLVLLGLPFGVDRVGVVFAARRLRRLHPQVLDPVEVEAAEDVITMRRAGELHTWSWDLVKGFQGRGRVLLIVSDGMAFISVPERVLDGDTSARLLALANG